MGAASNAYATISSELDQVTVDCEKKAIHINALEQEREKLQREVAIVGGELEDATAERDKRGASIARLEDEMDALRRRHAADKETEQMRFSAAESKIVKLDTERTELEQKLLSLQRTHHQTSDDFDHEKRSSELLRKELEELRKTKADGDKRLHELEAELEALKRKMDSELANERARYEALQTKYSRLEGELAKHEKTIAELKARIVQLQASVDNEAAQLRALQSEYSNQSSLLQKAESSLRLLEQELAQLRDQLADCRNECSELRLQISTLEKRHSQDLVDIQDIKDAMRMRKLRSGVFLVHLILERMTERNFVSFFYYWGQVAADGHLQRGATELASIVDSVQEPEGSPKYDDWSIEAIDIHAMSKSFGL